MRWPWTASLRGSGPKRGPSDAEDARVREEGWPGIPGLHLPTVTCVTLDELLNLSGPWESPCVYSPTNSVFLPFVQPDVLTTGFALCLLVLSAAEFTERSLGVRQEDGLWNTPERA